MMKKPFSHLESWAQRLIEGSFSRFFGGQVAQQEIAAELARALEDSFHHGEIATVYVVHVADGTHKQLQSNPGIEERWSNYLVQLAQRAEMSLPTRPLIRLEIDHNLAKHQMRIEASHQLPELSSDTKQLTPYEFASPGELQQTLHQLDAFLIIDGQQHVSLLRPLISLGRSKTNDIIFDQPTISRKHAQIRWRFGRFVLYDLGSNLGTKVNDQVITECVLRPGDVIGLGSITLIYGEGASRGRRTNNRRYTQPDKGDTLAIPRIEPVVEEPEGLNEPSGDPNNVN